MKSLSLILFAAMASLALLISPSMAQPSPDSRTDPYAYNKFSPSMAIIIVVLIAALFFMGFFSIYIRHCSDGTVAGVGGAIAGAGATRRVTRGLDAAVIATFPTLEYSAVKGLKIGKGALECAVCLCEFEEDETLRLIPKCDHVFHPECIDTWLELRTTCPVCRAELAPGEAVPAEPDIENQSDEVALAPTVEEPAPPPALRRNRTRGASLSSGFKRFFPRSHSTGHSLVQPGESTERFTLRLPADVRKEIVNRQLNRASSMVVQPTEGSNRGTRLTRKPDRLAKSDRWIFTRTSSFFARMSSMKSPKVAATESGEGPSKRINVDPE